MDSGTAWFESIEISSRFFFQERTRIPSIRDRNKLEIHTSWAAAKKPSSPDLWKPPYLTPSSSRTLFSCLRLKSQPANTRVLASLLTVSFLSCWKLSSCPPSWTNWLWLSLHGCHGWTPQSALLGLSQPCFSKWHSYAPLQTRPASYPFCFPGLCCNQSKGLDPWLPMNSESSDCVWVTVRSRD